MEGLNRVILAGNIGAEAELHFTQGGNAVLKFRLATNESWVDRDGERRERTEWHSCNLFGRRAEALSKILRKGMPLLVEGRLQTSSWDDREGIKRYRTDVIATNVVLLGGRRDGDGGATNDRAGGGGGRGRGPKLGGSELTGGDDEMATGPVDDIPFVTSLPGRWGV